MMLLFMYIHAIIVGNGPMELKYNEKKITFV